MITVEQQQLSRNEWSIELLRGIAALMVVAAHYWQFTGFVAVGIPGMLEFARTGVDLFFVISGFVFAPYLFGRRLAVVPHLIRRLFRIYPLYLVSLFVYVGLRWYQGIDPEHILKHLFFLFTLQSRDIMFFYNAAFWSLPPEVEFYLALPLLSFLVREIRTLTAMVLLALGVHLILAYASPTDLVFDKVSVALVHLPGVLIEFLLGAVAWFVVSKSPGQLKRTAMLVTGIVLWLLLAYVFSKVNNGGVGGEQAFAANPLLRGNVGLFASVTYALIVAAWVGWVKDAPSWIHQVAITLGNLSFGLYLFHNAALIVVKALTQIQTGPLFVLYCFVLTALVSWLLHVVCERPLRNFGRSWAARNQY